MSSGIDKKQTLTSWFELTEGEKSAGSSYEVAVGLLQGLQRRVALEALRKSSSSFGAEVVASQAASTGVEAGVEQCERALTRKQTLLGGGALERSHGAPFERLAQLGDALGGVGPLAIIVEAAELVVAQAEKVAQCQRALTGK